MGKYDPWDAFFSDLEGTEVRFTLDYFAEVTGVELPPSAYSYVAWWSGVHYYAKWREHGWYARPHLSTAEIVFTREAPRRGRPRGSVARPKAQSVEVPVPREPDADLILIGCVAQKRTVPSVARDLYTSTLWKKRRSYAEGTSKPWMILSAEYGLVNPDEVIEPYDRYLESQPRQYRDQWSRRTSRSVIDLARSVGASTIEMHAGAAYLAFGLIAEIEMAGFTVTWPLKGMRIGEQLSWYGSDRHPPRTDVVTMEASLQEVTGDHIQRIAHDYSVGLLGESWGELPETKTFRLPSASPRDGRLWLTFICAMDRARDAEALWTAGLRAWEKDRWLFDPDEVATRPFSTLADTLRTYRLSQKHAQDASAWRIIGETLSSGDCPEPIRSVMDGGPVDAGVLRHALEAEFPGGTKRFPLVSGPKIGPMWVRMMAFPGGADVRGIEVIPVAVDTHVQRVTEMLGLVNARKLDDRHRQDIQDVWFEGVRLAGSFGGPEPIDGTAAALDPALWVLGKNGCSPCERAGRKIEVGSICQLCILGRIG